MHTVPKISESMHTVPKISESMHSVQKIIWIYATCQKNNLNLCTLSKKYSESMHTVQKIIWISAGKPWACHGWSRCNGICLVSWHDICNQKLTYCILQPWLVWFLMRKFTLFLAQCINQCRLFRCVRCRRDRFGFIRRLRIFFRQCA